MFDDPNLLLAWFSAGVALVFMGLGWAVAMRGSVTRERMRSERDPTSLEPAQAARLRRRVAAAGVSVAASLGFMLVFMRSPLAFTGAFLLGATWLGFFLARSSGRFAMLAGPPLVPLAQLGIDAVTGWETVSSIVVVGVLLPGLLWMTEVASVRPHRGGGSASYTPPDQ